MGERAPDDAHGPRRPGEADAPLPQLRALVRAYAGLVDRTGADRATTN